MRHILAMACAVAALSAAGPVIAAPKACVTQGDPTAKTIATDTMPAALSMGIAIGPALFPETSSKVTRRIDCQRGETFTVGRDEFTLTGENTDAAPRRVVAKSRSGPTFYLSPIPNLIAQMEAEKAGLPTEGVKAAYALVRMDRQGVATGRIYSAIPEDERLRQDVQASLRGEIAPLAAIIRGNKSLQLYIPDDGGDEQAAVEAPAVLRPLQEPDGTVFIAAENGAARHAATGFVCPAEIGGRKRREMVIYDASAGGRDVSCGYGTANDASWHTLYLTRVHGAHAAVFNAYVEGAKLATPALHDVPSPVVVGAAPAPTSAAFWRSPDGTFNGLALSSIGDWQVKLRTTYHAGQEAAVAAVAQAMFKAAYEQIKVDLPQPPAQVSIRTR